MVRCLIGVFFSEDILASSSVYTDYSKYEELDHHIVDKCIGKYTLEIFLTLITVQLCHKHSVVIQYGDYLSLLVFTCVKITKSLIQIIKYFGINLHFKVVLITQGKGVGL